jgi:exportin-2 (importin alpha re-exporter)
MDPTSLSNILAASMSPNPAEIKQAEAQLNQAEDEAAGTLLLNLMNMVFNSSVQVPVRQSAAIFSKNLLKRRWVASDDADVQHKPLEEGFKEQVRSVLVEATCGPSASPQPRLVQLQINAIISFIAEIDFPARWPTLLPSLVKSLQSAPSDELRLNALTCVCAVFRKYKTASRSTEILMELKYLLPLFQEVHLDLFKSVLPAIVGNPAGASKEIFAAMEQILEIFYSLNVVDIPEHYQDNTQVWLSGFLEILNLPILKTSNTDEPGPVETLKTLACENLSLYADKYQEPFEPFVASSVKAVWSLLVSLDLNESRFDLLVSAGIRFLSSAANTRWAQSPFEQQDALVQICEKLVLPNIQLREIDIELFTDNPDDYMRKDLQNADAETRRRSAVDLVKALSKFYESQVTEILIRYVQSLLGGVAQQNPRAKDACIQLVSAVAVKGETRAQGVTQVNTKVDVNQYFVTQIVPDLRAGAGTEERGVLVASALKFVILFRTQIDRAALNESLPLILGLVNLKSPKVVQCYAAHAVTLLSSVSGVAIPPSAIAPAIESGLAIIGSNGEQNEYLIKLVAKLMAMTAQQLMDGYLTKLLILVSSFSSNPVNAVFTHFLFEALGSAVAGASPAARDRVAPQLLELLQRNVMEYMPYAFQVLALVIEASSQSSEIFKQLLGMLLAEEVWKNVSLVPGLVRILSAYLHRPDLYAVDQTLVASRAQLLLSSTKFESAGFDLVNALFTSGNVQDSALQPILMTMLTKIHTRRVERFVRSFSLSLACLVGKSGPEILLSVLEKIQPGLSTQVVNGLWMAAVAAINGSTLSGKQKKVYCVGIAKLLSSQAVMGNAAMVQLIVNATEGLMVTNPSKAGTTTATPNETEKTTTDEHEFEVSYSKLSSTTNPRTETDFLPEIHSDGITALKTVIKGMQASPALAQWASI